MQGTGQRSPFLDEVRAAIRVRHYSIRTERAYLDWIRRFILFHGKRHPRDMGESDVAAISHSPGGGATGGAGDADLHARDRARRARGAESAGGGARDFSRRAGAGREGLRGRCGTAAVTRRPGCGGRFPFRVPVRAGAGHACPFWLWVGA